MDPADPSNWHDDPREPKPEQREPPRTWRRGPPLAPRPAHNLIKEPTLTNLLDWHSHNIDRDPLFAHYSSAAAAVLAALVRHLPGSVVSWEAAARTTRDAPDASSTLANV